MARFRISYLQGPKTRRLQSKQIKKTDESNKKTSERNSEQCAMLGLSWTRFCNRVRWAAAVADGGVVVVSAWAALLWSLTACLVVTGRTLLTYYIQQSTAVKLTARSTAYNGSGANGACIRLPTWCVHECFLAFLSCFHFLLREKCPRVPQKTGGECPVKNVRFPNNYISLGRLKNISILKGRSHYARIVLSVNGVRHYLQ